MVDLISESLGGITPHALAHVGYLARRAKGKGARDSTKYSKSRTGTRSYFVHHCQRLALAAKQYNAKAILRSLAGYKHQAITSSAGGGPRAGSTVGAA